ncbi:MAG TPA: hypothetical protein VKY41_09740 [Xanthomarina sp.]|nr:hypothetical protein [Xanthomarina sp.]
MKNSKSYIKFLKHTLLLLVVMFALAPCSVKESGATVFNIDYQRPLNKSKALVFQDNSCENLEFNLIETVKTQDDFELNVLATKTNNTVLLAPNFQVVFQKNYYKNYSESSLPLYILYSQLKLDIA